GRDAVAADPRIQGLGRDVYSTNNLCHDNLPCPCDWRSSDCTVVRDNGGGPNAHPRLWPRGARAQLAPPGGRRPLATSQRRCYLSTPPTSRYKGARADSCRCRPLTPTLSPVPGARGTMGLVLGATPCAGSS